MEAAFEMPDHAPSAVPGAPGASGVPEAPEAPPQPPGATAAADPERRALLAVSDRLLDQVETLRLQDRVRTPPRLREAIETLERRLGRERQAGNPKTLQAAHDLVFAVQERLLASGRGQPSPRGHHGRAVGAPIVTSIDGRAEWKLLALPPRPEEGSGEAAWQELVRSTLERALDRWAWAQHHAQRAARQEKAVGPALLRAHAAWENYWELRCEAERLGVGVS